MNSKGNSLRHWECEIMRKVKNITVSVSPELYRQTRMLAVEFDTTVTAMVTYLLPRMPKAIRDARYPKDGPKPVVSVGPAPSADTSSANPSGPPDEEFLNSRCTPVCEDLTYYI